MEDVERSLVEQNVRNYIDVLAWEVDPKGRSIYSALLRIEEDRYAKEVASLDAIEDWIQKCDRHIAQLKTLMGKSGLATGKAYSQCRSLIQQMLQTKATLISLRQQVLGSIEISERFLARRDN